MRTFMLLVIGMLIGAILYRLWQNYQAKQRSQQALDNAGDATPKPVERMVRCHYCGVHVPETEALEEDGYYFCCDAHRLAAQREKD